MVPENVDQQTPPPVEHHPVTAQVLMALFLAVGSSVFAGYSLGILNVASMTNSVSNTAAVGSFSLKLPCVAVNPPPPAPGGRSDGLFLINTKNTVDNPVIVNIPTGACNPNITATPSTPTSDFSSKTGGIIVGGGTFYEQVNTSKVYGIEAVAYDVFPSDATHPNGYLKMWFKNPTSNGAAMSGYLLVTPVFARAAPVAVGQIGGTQTTSVGESVVSAAPNTVFVKYDQTPLISLSYSFAGVTGQKVWERVVDQTGTVVSDRKVNVGFNSVSWTPAKKEWGKVYSVILCPRDVDDTPLIGFQCTTKTFVVNKS